MSNNPWIEFRKEMAGQGLKLAELKEIYKTWKAERYPGESVELVDKDDVPKVIESHQLVAEINELREKLRQTFNELYDRINRLQELSMNDEPES